MKARIAFVVGAATGYVLGARAGRERYEQIKTQATNVWHDPKVQEGVKTAEGAIREKAPVVAEKAKETAAAAAEKTKEAAVTATEKAKEKAGDVREARAEAKAEKKAEKAVQGAPADTVSDPVTAPEDEGPLTSEVTE